MVYARVMLRSLRATLLILILLVQGLGNAFAAAPSALRAAINAGTESVEAAALPCHDDAEAAATMACCDDGSCCATVCFGAVPGLAPAATDLTEYLHAHFAALAGQPDLRPAHLHLLLRPPAPSAS